jgi:hypothetical protein
MKVKRIHRLQVENANVHGSHGGNAVFRVGGGSDLTDNEDIQLCSQRLCNGLCHYDAAARQTQDQGVFGGVPLQRLRQSHSGVVPVPVKWSHSSLDPCSPPRFYSNALALPSHTVWARALCASRPGGKTLTGICNSRSCECSFTAASISCILYRDEK